MFACYTICNATQMFIYLYEIFILNETGIINIRQNDTNLI